MGEAVLSLEGLCRKAVETKSWVKMVKDGQERFWIENLQHPNFPGQKMGRIEMSLELLPKATASQMPAGLGRSDPNSNPFLPAPEGRINWSLFRPLEMLREILGPELYAKCWIYMLCGLLFALCIMMAPMIASNFISSIIFKI
eukprot:g75447.t1